MLEAEYLEFSELLTATCALLSRGQYSPDSMNRALFWRALKRFPMDDVRAALDAHIADPQRGRFVPVPADLIAQLEARADDDGRPDGDEAWAIVVPAVSEAVTIVWSAEMAAAWGQVLPLVVQGDMVAARKSFLSIYARLVAEARAEGLALQWTACLGHDKAGQADAIRTAAQRGRIAGGPAADVLGLDALPAPSQAVALLAAPNAGAGGGGPSGAKVAALNALQALRHSIAARDLHAGEIDDTERRNATAQKGLVADAVAEYELRVGSDGASINAAARPSSASMANDQAAAGGVVASRSENAASVVFGDDPKRVLEDAGLAA